MSEQYEHLPLPPQHLTIEQDVALRDMCERWNVDYNPSHYIYRPIDGLPEGYVSGFLGGDELQKTRRTIYVGCAPDGRISS